MESVIRFSLKQKVFYNLLFVLLMVAGSFGLLSLPNERYPNVNFGEVTINTFYPGASPTEVEALITREIEQALEGLEDVEWITAKSSRERSSVRLKFIDDSDYDGLFDEMRFRVLTVMEDLPDGIDPPVMHAAKVADFLPVVVVNLSGDHDNRALALMGEEIRTAILKIPNVLEVQTDGEYTREFHVVLDPVKLRRHGLTFDAVSLALERSNVSIPAGDHIDATGDYSVRVDEKFRSRADVLNTIVRRDLNGELLRVADLIESAGLDYRDPQVISSVNGTDALALKVIKDDRGNTVAIRDAVVEVVERFRPTLADQAVTLTLTQDSSTYVREALSTLGLNLAVGLALVLGIVWYFMGLRNAGLTIIGVPFSFLITMLIMYLTGNSLNEITLFAFVLVSGIVVDDAIVVIENIFRHTQSGDPLHVSIVRGTAEVALPVIAATLTTIAAFMPMLMMTGATGEFFAQIPKAVSFALAASLLECLLILPIHYLDFGPRPDGSKPPVDETHDDTVLIRVLRRLFTAGLGITLRFPKTSVSLVLLAFVAALGILVVSISGKAPLIRIQFFPDDYRLYYVDIVGPPTTPITEIDTKVKAVSRFIMDDGPGYAASASGFAGFIVNDDYEPVFGNNRGTVMVAMPQLQAQAFASPIEHLDAIRQRLRDTFENDGFHLRVHPQKDGPPQGRVINIRIIGSDFNAIDGLATELQSWLDQHPDIGPHLTELENDRGQPARVLNFRVLQDRALEYELSPRTVAALAASVLDGRFVGKYRLPDEEIDLRVKVASTHFDSPSDALQIPLLEHPSGPLRLGDVARTEFTTEPSELNRYREQRSVTLTADIVAGAPITTPSVVAAVQDHHAKIRERFAGATVTYGGEHEDTQRSYRSLAYAFIVAVLLMYLVLAAQFQSYVQPMIILSAIIFALIGVVFGKFITQGLFTVNSFIAVIGVAGVVVNDSLVLIDFINKRYRAGMSRMDAIWAGAQVRLRPIVLTTLTTSLGLLPMALGIPYYSLVWGAMASTFVTGLATATALTLFIVPVLWNAVAAGEERRQARRERRAKTEPDQS